MMNPDKIGGIGASEIGKLFTRDGINSKTAQSLILEKVEEMINGYRRELTTVAMQHGLFNEEEAFHHVVKPLFPSSRLRSDETIFIKDHLWATPDITDEDQQCVIDIKCPYTISSFFKNISNVPKTYIAQIQCQMLATGYDKGVLCYYLTSNKIDEYGNKIEYNIPIEDRFELINVPCEVGIQDEIMGRHEQFLEKRNLLHDMIKDVPMINDMDFFYLNKEKKVTRLKDKSNVYAWDGKIIKNQNVFYVAE